MLPMQIARSIVLFSIISGLISCSGGEPPTFGEPRPMHLPAGTNSMGPRLATGSDGTIVLSWMQRDESGATLRYSELGIGEWQQPIDVVSDPEMFVNWADLPSVTPIGDGHWVAHWLSKRGEATYAYDVLLAQSSDGGSSWSAPVRPHADGTPTEHGFVSIYPEGDATGLLWLDGRKTAAAAPGGPAASSMTLRSAAIDTNGAIARKQLVDDIVCDCCQTDVAVSSDGPIAVYRDRTVDEIRDIYVTRFSDGEWQAGVPVADDGWRIEGCPVNGPAIAAHDDLVAIAWFTAANNQSLVRTAISTNAGRSFGPPVEIASSRASGHVGIDIIDRASVVVSWVEADNRGSNAINIRSLTRQGKLGRTSTIGRSTLLRIYPQMTRHDDKLILVWTDEITDASEIVSVEVPIPGFYER